MSEETTTSEEAERKYEVYGIRSKAPSDAEVLLSIVNGKLYYRSGRYFGRAEIVQNGDEEMDTVVDVSVLAVNASEEECKGDVPPQELMKKHGVTSVERFFKPVSKEPDAQVKQVSDSVTRIIWHEQRIDLLPKEDSEGGEVALDTEKGQSNTEAARPTSDPSPAFFRQEDNDGGGTNQADEDRDR